MSQNFYELTVPDNMKGFCKNGAGPFVQGILDGYTDLYADSGDFEKMQKRVSKFRDLTLVDLIGDIVMVIACDSNAGCGEKPDDTFHWPYEMAVKSMLKVPLMEVLAAGAAPMIIIDNLCMEMEPTGRKIIKYMREQLREFGFDPDVQLTGSTEDNAKTTQTGTGLTVIGIATKQNLRLSRTKKGDMVACVGVPKGGPGSTHTEDDPDIAGVRSTLQLCSLDSIHEILPVGSHGVLYEADELAKYSSCAFEPLKEMPPIKLVGSAGASTAVLVSFDRSDLEVLTSAVSIPVFPIGTMK